MLHGFEELDLCLIDFYVNIIIYLLSMLCQSHLNLQWCFLHLSLSALGLFDVVVQMGIAPLKKSLRHGNLWESRLECALTWSTDAGQKAETIILHACK